MRRLAIALLLSAVAAAQLASLGSASAEVTRDDIARADAARRQVQAKLESVTARYEQNIEREEALRDELRMLAVELSLRQQDLAATEAAAKLVVREMYMNAGSTGVALLFDSASLTEIPVRASYLDLATSTDVAALARLEAVEASYLEQQDRLAAAAAEQEQVVADLDADATEIMSELEQADADYRAVVAAWEQQEAERRRREEEERQRREEEARRAFLATSTTTTVAVTTTVAATSTTVAESTTTTTVAETTTTTTIAPPAQPGGMACPVDGAVSFVDSWGAPRSGGRAHEGVDMIAARGTPLVAIESGSIRRMGNGGLGGITIWLRGASGDEYYYAHLDAWEDGLYVGQPVSVGERIGYVGNTGNARYTLPHLHFELHPGGGAAVNPYPLVKSLCG